MAAAVELTEPAPRRVRMTRVQRREHFLDTAAELVVDAGLEAVTMERVAAKAGVSKALGYAYFDNSDELLAALFDREMASYDRAIAAATAGATTFEERLRGVVVAMFDMVAERGRLFGTLLHGQSSAPSTLGERRAARKGVAEAYIGGLVEQEFGLARRQALTVAAIWIASTGGAIDSWIARRGSRRELTDLFVSMTIGGVRGLAAEHRPP